MTQVALYRKFEKKDIEVHNIPIAPLPPGEAVRVFELTDESLGEMIDLCVKHKCTCGKIVKIYREFKTPGNLLSFVKDKVADGDCEDLLAKLMEVKENNHD